MSFNASVCYQFVRGLMVLQLRQSGIGSILDYAAEADLVDEADEEDDRRDGVV